MLGLGKFLREIGPKVAPRLRRAAKFAANDLAMEGPNGEPPLIDPAHAPLAESLVDLGFNIVDRMLEQDQPEPEPNPLEPITMGDLLAEIARRTGREVMMGPSQPGTGESEE